MSSQLAKSHYELFALPERYALSETVLDERYRELQRTMHPDKFANASDQERRLSMQHAAQINEAYQVLKHPVNRGRYLLELRGCVIEEEKSTIQDTGFLMEQMELRETLSEIAEQTDALQALDEISARVRDNASMLEEKLTAALDVGSTDDDIKSATDLVLKMQFYNRLQSEISELESELEDELY